MGKHSAPKAPSHGSRYRKAVALIPALIAVLIGTVMAVVFFTADPYAPLLEEAGVTFLSCSTDEEQVSLVLEGDGEGILQCRAALNALRASETPPKALHWTLMKNNEILLTGSVEDLTYIPAPSSPRVETLSEELTLLKLKYELEQSGLAVIVTARPSVGIDGKTVLLTVETNRDGAINALKTVPAAINAVNEEGGGILRCTVRFTEHGALIAAADYDFLYGDTLLSSALCKE